jgi:hypothetical protein
MYGERLCALPPGDRPATGVSVSDPDEKELVEFVERGEWKSAGGGKREPVWDRLSQNPPSNPTDLSGD